MHAQLVSGQIVDLAVAEHFNLFALKKVSKYALCPKKQTECEYMFELYLHHSALAFSLFSDTLIHITATCVFLKASVIQALQEV